MKRFVWLLGLMALSSPACARDYSFVFHGHDIHIEAAMHRYSRANARHRELIASPGSLVWLKTRDINALRSL